jgi:hypothetical protein
MHHRDKRSPPHANDRNVADEVEAEVVIERVALMAAAASPREAYNRRPAHV